jgi:hypothetical protein
MASWQMRRATHMPYPRVWQESRKVGHILKSLSPSDSVPMTVTQR